MGILVSSPEHLRLSSLVSRLSSRRVSESGATKEGAWLGVKDWWLPVSSSPPVNQQIISSMKVLFMNCTGSSSLMAHGFLETMFVKLTFAFGNLTGYGSLYVSTPVDPVFVLLPIFEEARMKVTIHFYWIIIALSGALLGLRFIIDLLFVTMRHQLVAAIKENDQGMYRQLDEILYVEGYPGYQHLLSMTKDTMKIVCEVKEIGSLQYFRLDNSKVLTWLCCKVQNLKSTFLKLDKNYAAQEERETLKDAVSILGEYVTDKPWLTLLCNHLQLEIGETHKEGIQAETSQNLPESNLASSHAFQSTVVNGRSMVSAKRQPKKMKTETNSKNIRDMFQKATRKGTS
ncbi:hypothetical protein ZIOFF_014073 [Zingiber officinale]|uniref:Ribonuclease H2 subunit B wHTH domain-containing protein n=1 Tax=Zingiber officinale TaxID=94328 RepID=A0A8J5I059_ZINOF|nr:hypothetical protein ZIOFF_014073 [Zingiber officinale]